MKKTIIKLSVIIGLISISCKKAQTKGRQMIITPEKTYYTDYYIVYFDPNCIEFTSYNGDNDSSFVKVCPPWDVKPNLEYKEN